MVRDDVMALVRQARTDIHAGMMERQFGAHLVQRLEAIAADLEYQPVPEAWQGFFEKLRDAVQAEPGQAILVAPRMAPSLPPERRANTGRFQQLPPAHQEVRVERRFTVTVGSRVVADDLAFAPPEHVLNRLRPH